MLKNFLQNFNILNVFYPKFCAECNVPILHDSIFCSECKKSVQYVTSINLKITEKHSLRVLAAAAYNPPVKKLVLKKHYDDVIASKQLAKLILEFSTVKNFEFDFIVPVPLHWTRFSKRGFNQSQLIAKELSRNLKIPMLKLLKRKKKTFFQSTLSGDRKEENVKNAFTIKNFFFKNPNELIKDKKILLVDDLCTSGSTLKSAAKVILPLKPENVMAIVACRAC
ncbi:TPA: hypothetical protein DEO28_01365 [Candidatus Dependentiae bacterium]|nr:MAG: competence protein [candidate division TM6 bacterium GW2011_GWE2_31_21]KKP53715.1 MAG: competence protein [candidate division TM6 bacterium GW2011_GWF2_33_332]HBS48533.1 hypothetical protein [Candidatus Dependentiae bacterium]HBZ73148.1 hypothetical protein [Candidatus Dependentiae bacterium]